MTYAKNMTSFDGSVDFCYKRSYDFANLNGNVFDCINFNLADLNEIPNKFSNKFFFTFYQKIFDTIDTLSIRINKIFLDHSDQRIRDFFSQEKNINLFKNFLMNIDFDAFKISEFNGNLESNTFNM